MNLWILPVDEHTCQRLNAFVNLSFILRCTGVEFVGKLGFAIPEVDVVYFVLADDMATTARYRSNPHIV